MTLVSGCTVPTCDIGCPEGSDERRLGGLFGGFVAALISIPCAAALQVIVKDIWQATEPGGLLSDGPGPDPAPGGPAGSGPGGAGVPEDGRA